MKLAFTTLACPDWDLDTIIQAATDAGYDGIDFRGYLGEMQIFVLPEFREKAAETARRISQAGLEVPCLSTGALLVSATEEAARKHLAEVKAYVRLCETFGTRFLRVFGGKLGDMSRSEAIRHAARNLKNMATVAADHGITVLVETHDDWLDCRYMKALMETADSDAAGILWDIHHPYRHLGEPPQVTWEETGRWISGTHWKDSVPKPGAAKGAHTLCLSGHGDIPYRETLNVLKNGGYDGYLTFEWEKAWHPDLPNPDVALPQHARYMRKLLAE